MKWTKLPQPQSSDTIPAEGEMQAVHDKIKHAGIPLSDWQKLFASQFTSGELCQMHIGKMPWPYVRACTRLETFLNDFSKLYLIS